MPAVREKDRIAIACARGDSDRDRSAARRRDAIERGRGIGRKDDNAIAIPRAAAAGRSIAHRLGRAACDCDLPELSLGEESDDAAIRRPERKSAVLGSWQTMSLGAVERPNPQRALAAGSGDY